MKNDIKQELFCDACGTTLDANMRNGIEFDNRQGGSFYMYVCDDCFVDVLETLNK